MMAMRVILQIHTDAWTDLFWKYMEDDDNFQSLVSLWLQSTQEVAEKLQIKTATEKEKSAVLHFLTEVGVVVIENQLTTQSAQVQSTEVAMVRTDMTSSSDDETSVDARQQSGDINPVGNVENISGPSEQQVNQICLRGDRNIKKESLDYEDMNKDEEEKEEGEEGEEDTNNDDDDDDDEDYDPADDINDEDDYLEELIATGDDKDEVAIMQAIESSLKAVQHLSETSTDSDSKVVNTTDSVQLSLSDGACEGQQVEAFKTEQVEDAFKNNISDNVKVTDITSVTSQLEGETGKEQKLTESSSKTISLPRLNGKIDFRCKICFNMFDDSSSLQQHMDETHNKYKKYACTLCNKRFFRPYILKRHEKRHQEGRLMKCENCHKLLKTENFKGHVCERITVRKNKKCNVCGNTFLTSIQLARHSRQHQKVQPRLPPVVTRSRSCALQLRKNAIALATSKTKTTWCDLCKRHFASVNGYKIHVRVVHEKHKPHLCNVCGKGFNRPYQLKAHSKVHDPNRILPPRIYPSRKGKTFETKYECKKCFQSYKTRRPFEKHQCKERAFKFTCKLCGIKSKTEDMLKKHDAEFHKRTKNYFCDVCGAGFVQRSNMNRHRGLHEAQNMVACEICGKIFRSKSYLHKHQVNMHWRTKNEAQDMVKSSQQCEICGKVLTNETTLKAHKILHQPKQFKCNLCESMFRQKGQLKIHQESVHFKLRENLCQFCGKGFNTRGRVKVHIKQVHEKSRPHICQECGKRFSVRGGLARHLQSHVRKKKLQAIPRPIFPCDQCDRVCVSKSQLAYHQVTHNPERNFKCDLCDRAFKHKGALETHHKTVHLGIKPYKCPECDKRFSNKTHLKIHMQRLHSEDGINKIHFPCELCNRVFRHKSEYEEHQEWHKGLRKFICDVCGKEFPSRTPLRRHKKIHVDDAWRCSDCGKGFKNNELRAKHRMQVHFGVLDWNKCKECDKEFTTHQSLQRHMKNHKGIAWKCAFCGEKFPTVYAKEKHRKEQHGKTERGQTFGQL